ncbi:MAG TPA: guanylate kinase [Planctomycetota bacterium]|nr:guanylate kinase [Planctomycetota bacterium]
MVVISGPSGSGKTSVVKALKADPNIEFSVSATTRARRPGEQDGVDYHFLTHAEFMAKVAAGEFLEWAEYNGRCYGTLRAPMQRALEQGRIFLLEIEVQGTRQLREGGVPGLYVFLAPPSLEELRRRLLARGTDGAEEVERRVAIAAEEMRHQDLYDHVIVNVDLADTIARVRALLRS